MIVSYKLLSFEKYANIYGFCGMLKIIDGTLFYGHFAWNFLALLAMGFPQQIGST